jgi:hypothetical protein
MVLAELFKIGVLGTMIAILLHPKTTRHIVFGFS